MTKAKWEATPFQSLEEAHKTAEVIKLQPDEMQESGDGRIRFFKFSEGRELHTIAQAATGGPVREKTEKQVRSVLRKVSGTDVRPRYNVGPWLRDEKGRTLDQAIQDLLNVFLNPDNVERLEVVMFRYDTLEVEYHWDGGTTWIRVIDKSGLTNQPIPTVEQVIELSKTDPEFGDTKGPEMPAL